MTNEVQFKIEAYNEFNAKMEKLKDVANFIPDTSTAEGYEKSKRIALDIGKVATNLEKARKKEKDFYLQSGREVDSQAKVIKEKLDDMRAPHLEAYKAVDNAEKLAKEKRIAECQAKIDAMTCLIDRAEFASSADIAAYIEQVDAVEPEEGFYELTGDAFAAQARTLKTLSAMYQSKKQAEIDAIELEKLRAEQLERDQKERDERIAREANERAAQAEADKIAAEKAAIEAEQRAIELAKQVAIDAENERLASIEREKIAAENARLAEVARQEFEAKKKADELAKLEADKKHVAKIRGEIKDDLIALGVDEKLAKSITLALGKSIRNIRVIYQQ